MTSTAKHAGNTRKVLLIIGVALLHAVASAQTIDAVSPANTTVGEGSFALTVTGEGFVSGSQVLWNGIGLTTDYQSPKQLVAQVSAGRVAAAGNASISVINPGSQASTGLTFTIAQSSLPDGVDLLLGIGTAIRGPISDYTITNNFLAAKNLGYAIPEALVGISIPVYPKASQRLLKNLGVFASAQFSSSTSNNLVSYTFGASIHLNRYMHFLAGYSLQPTSQPAVGFRNAAANYVASVCPTPTAPTCTAPFAIFNPSALRNNSLNAFDGFPVPAAGTTGFSYSGTNIETEYKSGLFIGFAFPLSFRSGLEGGGN